MKLTVTLFALVCCIHCLPAQSLFVDTMIYPVHDIVTDFFDGSCVDVTAVEHFGEPTQLSFFEGSQSGIGLNAGLLFATGRSEVAVGPNNSNGASMGFGQSTPDTLLSSITAGALFDRSMLHMSIVPHTDSIGFRYVFASEEYCEYVNTQFNDAFGFWVKGPGVSLPNGAPRNIALVPGTATPVAINNVNFLTNSGLYINNTPLDGELCGQAPAGNIPTVTSLQFDGLLTVLTAGTSVVPEATYEVWIGIADVGDGVWDSGIFLGIESLCGDSLLQPAAGFVIQTDGNSATFVNTSRYGTHWDWDFGDGQTATQRHPAHTYSDMTQPHTVRLIVSNWCCSDTLYQTIGASAVAAPASPTVRVYPAAFEDQITIEPADPALAGKLRLSDVSGVVVAEQTFAGTAVLQTGNLPQGVYVLKISVPGQADMVRKLVRQ